MNPKDRKALEVAREALQWHSSGQARDALALIDERLQADEPNENPARPILEGWKLDRREDGSIGILGPVGGCIIDRKLLDYLGVHSVVLYALAEALLAVDGLPGRSQADEKPAECANGCPPMQVCDYCQGPRGKDKRADEREEPKPGDVLGYAKLVYAGRMPPRKFDIEEEG